jgi:hypothetical protein
MKEILALAVIVLGLFLGLQTHETAKANQISLSCGAHTAERSECVSLGPLAVNLSGVEFWVREFVHHALELPQSLSDLVSDEAGNSREAFLHF